MKLLLLNHVALLDNECIAKKVFEEEKECEMGLVNEVKDFLLSNNLSKNMIEQFSKKEWSRLISNAIEEKNKQDLMSLMRNQKKINNEEILDEQFELKDYMTNLTYEDAVIKFKLRAKVLKSIKTKFKKLSTVCRRTLVMYRMFFA